MVANFVSPFCHLSQRRMLLFDSEGRWCVKGHSSIAIDATSTTIICSCFPGRHSGGLTVAPGAGTGEHDKSSEAEDSRVLKLLTSRDGGSASKRRLLKVEGTSKASCQASFGC